MENKKCIITDTNISEYIEAGVKWYNPEKGYGFLQRDSDSADIMIHFSHLDKIGCPYILEGDRVLCEIGPGRKGLKVIDVREVKFGSSEPRSLMDHLKARITSFDLENLEEVRGIVKWYNSEKRYGFIYLDNMSREGFLHATVMGAAGYRSLTPGAEVLVKISKAGPGKEPQIVKILCEEQESKKACKPSFIKP